MRCKGGEYPSHPVIQGTLFRTQIFANVQPVAKKRLMVGLMSGTSADGIDAVVAEITPPAPSRPGKLRARIMAHYYRSFAPALRKRILDACVAGSVAEICELNFLLGRYFAQSA